MAAGDDQEIRHRGPTPPEGSLTLDEASRLPGLSGKNHMTIRRALEPARIGKWLPEGARLWCVVYDAKKAHEVATVLAERDLKSPHPPRRVVAPDAIAPTTPEVLDWKPTTFGRYLAPKEGFPSANVDLFFYFRIGDAPDKDWRVYTPRTGVIVEGTWTATTTQNVDRMIDEVMQKLWKSAGKALKLRRVSLFTWSAESMKPLVAK